LTIGCWCATNVDIQFCIVQWVVLYYSYLAKLFHDLLRFPNVQVNLWHKQFSILYYCCYYYYNTKFIFLELILLTFCLCLTWLICNLINIINMYAFSKISPWNYYLPHNNWSIVVFIIFLLFSRNSSMSGLVSLFQPQDIFVGTGYPKLDSSQRTVW